MATIREIRRKLHSVANIRKITQAMEMVAASRLRRAQAKAEQSRPYATKLKDILENLIGVTDDLEHPLMEPREVKRTGYVAIAGDRGLCGSYNHQIISTTEKLLKADVELFLIGRKVVEHFSGKQWPVGEAISDWGGKISYGEIEKFTHLLIDRFLKGELDEIWIIYTHFINAASRKIRVEKLLPIEAPKKEEKPPSYIFEPKPSQIFTELLPHYIVTKVQAALNEAYASELGARIFSMRAATKNAEEMIEKLTLVRNKVRQSGITRELIEITSGAESLK